MEILEDDLTGGDVAELLREHLAHMHEVTPPESIHAFDLAALRVPEITFWCAREAGELLGCAALRELDASTGEIKSMRTATAHLRRGIATRLLLHLLDEAARRGYRTLYLETGAMDAFAPARALYTRHGFRRCGPFGSYTDDPNSVFMTRDLP